MSPPSPPASTMFLCMQRWTGNGSGQWALTAWHLRVSARKAGLVSLGIHLDPGFSISPAQRRAASCLESEMTHFMDSFILPKIHKYVSF